MERLRLPAVEISLLLRSQLVDLQSHGGQLHPSDLVVDLGGDLIHLFLQTVLVLGQPLQSQSLDGKDISMISAG